MTSFLSLLNKYTKLEFNIDNVNENAICFAKAAHNLLKILYQLALKMFGNMLSENASVEVDHVCEASGLSHGVPGNMFGSTKN